MRRLGWLRALVWLCGAPLPRCSILSRGPSFCDISPLQSRPGLFTILVVCTLGFPDAIFDVSVPGGLTFEHENSPTSRKYLIEAMRGGVALLDYYNDGLLDLFLVNSGSLADSASPRESFERDRERYWNRLYRQNKDTSFTDVTEAAGLARAGNANYGMGVAAATMIMTATPTYMSPATAELSCIITMSTAPSQM